jgi:hypothetical protein
LPGAADRNFGKDVLADNFEASSDFQCPQFDVQTQVQEFEVRFCGSHNNGWYADKFQFGKLPVISDLEDKIS